MVAAVVAIVMGVVLVVPDNPVDDDPAADSVAVGFVRDMRFHHAQAVAMAGIIRDRTDDDELRTLASDIELTQQAQTGRMAGWLERWDVNASSVGTSMDWMNHGMDTMPGMATPEDVSSLQELPLAEAEVRFLALMIAHHQGAIEMAEAALEHDLPPEVERLATGIVEAQTSEISYMQDLLEARTP